VAKARERLAVNKKIMHRDHMERFNLKKLNEVEGGAELPSISFYGTKRFIIMFTWAR
jgi:hypothetical protein